MITNPYYFVNIVCWLTTWVTLGNIFWQVPFQYTLWDKIAEGLVGTVEITLNKPSGQSGIELSIDIKADTL
jgi:hypothetical protein